MPTTKPAGYIVWITGLSGSGKTTIARQVIELLNQQSTVAAHLDGDEVREAIGDNLGFSKAERLENAFRICRFASLLSSQGLTVVCSTMSLFPEVWQWNREHFPKYIEILVDCSREVRVSRDAKGIYSRYRDGSEANVVGEDIDALSPPEPHLIIDNSNSDHESVKRSAVTIVKYLQAKF